MSEMMHNFMVPGHQEMGRPFNTDNVQHYVAPMTQGTEQPGTRSAEHFEKMARLEHASVASFAVFSLQLLACGAPMSLVEDAHRAALDETKHTRMAMEMSRRAGADAGRDFAPFDRTLVIKVEPCIRELALSTLREACLAETASALMLFYDAASHAEGTLENRMLLEIGHDEMRHAVLGWKTLRWCLSAAGEQALQEEVVRIFKSSAHCELLSGCLEWLLGAGTDIDEVLNKLVPPHQRAAPVSPTMTMPDSTSAE